MDPKILEIGLKSGRIFKVAQKESDELIDNIYQNGYCWTIEYRDGTFINNIINSDVDYSRADTIGRNSSPKQKKKTKICKPSALNVYKYYEVRDFLCNNYDISEDEIEEFFEDHENYDSCSGSIVDFSEYHNKDLFEDLDKNSRKIVKILLEEEILLIDIY